MRSEAFDRLWKVNEVAEQILQNAPVDREPVAVERYPEEEIFQEQFGASGEVKQSKFGQSKGEMLWSEGFKSCTAVLLRSPGGETMFIHAEGGHWYAADKPWETDEEAQRFMKAHPDTQMIIVRAGNIGMNLFNQKLARSLLERLNVPIVKIIEVKLEYPDFGVAYDPKEDKIYIDQRGTNKLLTFNGFQG